DRKGTGVVARENEPREGLRPGDIGALADIDEEGALIDVEWLETRETQRRRTLRRPARRHAAQRFGDRGEWARRRAAAAAGDVDPAAPCPFAELACHRFGRVLVLAESVRQARVGMARREAFGEASELLHVRPQLLR